MVSDGPSKGRLRTAPDPSLPGDAGSRTIGRVAGDAGSPPVYPNDWQ